MRPTAATGSGRVAPGRTGSAVLVRRLATGSALATLARLFLLGSPVPRAEAAAALVPLELDSLAASGVVRYDGDQVRAAVRIGWCDELLVACDWEDARPLNRDHVVRVGPASLLLADLTVRRPGVEALDIGTGGGVQALLAAQHAATVVGTDLNPRALAYAALGGALNGTGNVSWRAGSLLDPVAGQRFDLVTVNPPFVISPDTAYLFRDGGEAGDGDTVSRRLVREVATILRPDGWATLLCSWVHSPAGDWSEPVRGWLAGRGCAAWVLRVRSQDPLAYAAAWNAQAHRSTDALGAGLDRWLAHYRRRSIEAIATGVVILHRQAGPDPLIWADDMPTRPNGPAGAQIQRVFAHQHRLSRLTDPAQLLDQVLAPLAGTRLDQTLYQSGDGYLPAAARLRLEPGLGLSASVPPAALPVVLALDGERPLRELITTTTDTGFDPTEVSTQALATARRLIALGLVDWPQHNPDDGQFG